MDLVNLIKADMTPALGVTEPGAIAFSVAKAKSYLTGEIEEIKVQLNSGLYKNAFTCGIPHSSHVGNSYAAALGAIAGDASLGLEVLAKVTPQDNHLAKEMIAKGKVIVTLNEVSSDIYLKSTVSTTEGSATVIIEGAHTNITKIIVNEIVLQDTPLKKTSTSNKTTTHLIHQYSLKELIDYVNIVPLNELTFINEAFTMNEALFEKGLASEKTSFVHYLYKKNNNQVFSKDEKLSASLLCNGAIEARVLGLNAPAMSITGSGSHGIICTLPLYASSKILNINNEKLLRSTLLSFLICTYIKEYSGKLSAFCGCAIAGGTGMAAGLCYLKGGNLEEISATIYNMASSITGMICDGGNQGCIMKGVAGVDVAFEAADFALNGIQIQPAHGINGVTPEETMKNMGQIASPGMKETEKTILDIFAKKQVDMKL